MKKKHLLIGIGIILVVLIVWGVKRQMFKCGDGVCHQKKEFASGICPQDCGINWRPYEKDQSHYFDNLYLLTFAGACGKL